MSQKVERRLEEFQECTSNVAIGAAPSTIGPIVLIMYTHERLLIKYLIL
jgi:hypothetical protein